MRCSTKKGMTMSYSSRRDFLRAAGAGALARFGMMNALAQSAAPDYKALVCVFLHGGNDGNNVLVPLTGANNTLYKQARLGLALPDGNAKLLPVQNTDGTAYGLNDGFQAIHPLWAQGKLAVLANAGMLVKPVTRSEYLAQSAPVPTNLFSHSDQTQQMQSGFPNPSGGTGWAGRVADAASPLNGGATFPAAFSMNGPALFCSGGVIQSATLLPGFNLDLWGMDVWPASAAQARKTALQQILTFHSGMTLVQAANRSREDALALNAMLKSTSGSPLQTQFPGTQLGQQLSQVANVINLRNSTGMKRQIFFASFGGFDTHGNQNWTHWDLLKTVGEALGPFYASLVEMGIADKVTTFTLSEFGRSLQPSGSGSDHGWGSHHILLGGAVNGGRVYGTFPTLALGGPDDSGNRGVWIPTTSIDQVGATLATWFGVPANQLPGIFPNLSNFPQQNLGFV
jgi:uncharacterized protein (DUF1501 family)